MRVAALYDVHGNVEALEAVLEAVDREGVDAVVFGGDLAWGPFPRATIELARSVANAAFILGNADELFAHAVVRPDLAERHAFVVEHVDDEALEWLASRPFSWSADDTLYVHANPRDTVTTYFEWSPDEVLAAALDGVDESRVVSGHVHMQSDRRVGDKRWICAGSVGMPYEDEPGAYWTLLADGVPSFRRSEYDLEHAAAAVRASGFPNADELADENILRVPSPAHVRATWGAG
jgi:putative phosphoesterase